jgi:hypothetical protein
LREQRLAAEFFPRNTHSPISETCVLFSSYRMFSHGMQFQVRHGIKNIVLDFSFARNEDFARLRHWRNSKQRQRSSPIQDALEYARLANKRFKSYRQRGRTVESLDELLFKIREQPRGEVVFTLMAHLPSDPLNVLGFCFCRRSWCHNIIIDFAAAYPGALIPGPGQIRGIGTGMLYSLVSLAKRMGVQTVWGEATENSVPFYEKILGTRDLLDHFFIEGEVFNHCSHEFRKISVGALETP